MTDSTLTAETNEATSSFSEPAFESLCRYLKNKKVKYCIMGNTSDYPNHMGDDIDIAVENFSLTNVLDVLNRFCKKELAHVVQVIPNGKDACTYVITGKDSETDRWFLKLDFFGDYVLYDSLRIPSETLINKRFKERGQEFFRPSHATECGYYLSKHLAKGDLNRSHWQHIVEEFSHDPEGVASFLKGYFHQGDVDALYYAMEKNDYATVISMRKRYKKILVPSSSFANFIAKLKKLRQWFVPTGLFLTFMGPDGSGKSSVIEALIKHLETVFVYHQKFHFRPLVQNRSYDPKLFDAPQEQPTRGTFMSLVKLIYYILDYHIGYWLSVRPRLARTQLVIFDRYFHDIRIDPKRFRFGASLEAVDFVGKFIPKPDVMFLLDAPADVLQSRKQDVSFEETKRQRDDFLTMFEALNNGTVIDASKTEEEVLHQVVDHIIETLSKRIQQQYKLKATQ